MQDKEEGSCVNRNHYIIGKDKNVFMIISPLELFSIVKWQNV